MTTTSNSIRQELIQFSRSNAQAIFFYNHESLPLPNHKPTWVLVKDLASACHAFKAPTVSPAIAVDKVRFNLVSSGNCFFPAAFEAALFKRKVKAPFCDGIFIPAEQDATIIDIFMLLYYTPVRNRNALLSNGSLLRLNAMVERRIGKIFPPRNGHFPRRAIT